MGFIVYTVTLLLWMIGWDLLDSQQWIPPWVVVLSGVAFSMLFAVAITRRMTRRKWTEALATNVDAYCKSVQPPAPEGTRVLLVRKAGDEITALLVGGRLVELLLTVTWRVSGAIV